MPEHGHPSGPEGPYSPSAKDFLADYNKMLDGPEPDGPAPHPASPLTGQQPEQSDAARPGPVAGDRPNPAHPASDEVGLRQQFLADYAAVMKAAEAAPERPAPLSLPRHESAGAELPPEPMPAERAPDRIRSPESLERREQYVERLAAYWQRVVETAHGYEMAAKPSGGDGNQKAGWELGWQMFSEDGKSHTTSSMVPRAMNGAYNGLRGAFPVDYLMIMPAENEERAEAGYTYYTYLTRSVHTYDARDEQPGLAVRFRIPKQGPVEGTSTAFMEAVDQYPELVDRLTRRLFDEEFSSGVVQRAPSQRLCVIMGKQFSAMLDGPTNAYTVKASTREHTRKVTAERLAKRISTFERELIHAKSDRPSTYYALADGSVAPGQAPGSGARVQFVDLPYPEGAYPRSGEQPVDAVLMKRM